MVRIFQLHSTRDLFKTGRGLCLHLLALVNSWMHSIALSTKGIWVQMVKVYGRSDHEIRNPKRLLWTWDICDAIMTSGFPTRERCAMPQSTVLLYNWEFWPLRVEDGRRLSVLDHRGIARICWKHQVSNDEVCHHVSSATSRLLTHVIALYRFR